MSTATFRIKNPEAAKAEGFDFDDTGDINALFTFSRSLHHVLDAEHFKQRLDQSGVDWVEEIDYELLEILHADPNAHYFRRAHRILSLRGDDASIERAVGAVIGALEFEYESSHNDYVVYDEQYITVKQIAAWGLTNHMRPYNER